MSVVSLATNLLWPKPPETTTNTPAFAADVVSGANQKRAIIFQAPKTGNIRFITLPYGTVTTATDVDTRLETLDSTGYPSGTLVATNTNFVTLAASFTGNAWRTIQLTADAPVNQGDLLAIVIAPSGSPNFQFRVSNFPPHRNMPQKVSYNGASWSNLANNAPYACIQYDDNSVAEIPGLLPVFNHLSSTFSSSSSPDELALRFRMPFSARVAGLWAWLLLSSSADFDVVLYDSDGSTVLATKSFDGDVRQSNSPGPYHLKLPSSVLLNANTYYRLSIRPSTTTTLTAYSIGYSSTTQMDAYGGRDIHHSTRTDGGSWTDTTTTRLLAGLMIDGIDIPSGGGGSPANYGFVA